jgi:hypothetical protein
VCVCVCGVCVGCVRAWSVLRAARGVVCARVACVVRVVCVGGVRVVCGWCGGCVCARGAHPRGPPNNITCTPTHRKWIDVMRH